MSDPSSSEASEWGDDCSNLLLLLNLPSTAALQPDDLLSVAALISKAKNLIYLRLACEFLLFKHWINSVSIYAQPYLTPLVPADVDDAHTMPLVLALKGVPELVVLFITGCFLN